MPDNGYGYDNERDEWSIAATERLFPSIADSVFNTRQDKIEYAWRNPQLERMDKHYGIDALLHTSKRNVAIAIRVRGVYYYHAYGDVTIRYDSLQALGKMLEVQKSIARFMFYAWVDTNSPGIPRYLIGRANASRESIKPATRLVNWHVIWLQRLVDLYQKGKLGDEDPRSNRDKSSRLIGISIPELKARKLIYKSKPEKHVWPKIELPGCNNEYIAKEEQKPPIHWRSSMFDETMLREAQLNELHHSHYNEDG